MLNPQYFYLFFFSGGGGFIYLNSVNPPIPSCLKCITAIAEFIIKFAGQAGTNNIQINYPPGPDIRMQVLCTENV